jgi:hypothetical protein
MMMQMVCNERGDEEIVAVVVTFMPTHRERVAHLARRLFENMRQELRFQKLIG